MCLFTLILPHSVSSLQYLKTCNQWQYCCWFKLTRTMNQSARKNVTTHHRPKLDWWLISKSLIQNGRECGQFIVKGQHSSTFYCSVCYTETSRNRLPMKFKLNSNISAKLKKILWWRYTCYFCCQCFQNSANLICIYSDLIKQSISFPLKLFHSWTSSRFQKLLKQQSCLVWCT